jgi:hypothetical protein
MTIGIAMAETMKGTVAQKELSLELSIFIADLDAFLVDPEHKGIIETGARLWYGNENYFSADPGEFRLFNYGEDKVKHLEYKMDFGKYQLHGIKNIQDNPGTDMMKDITTLYTTLTVVDTKEELQGTIYFDPRDFADLILDSIEVLGTYSLIERVKAHYKFLHFCFGEMAKEYILKKMDNLFGK